MADRFVEEPARRVPVLTCADVVVVGSGPSGLAAAIATAMQQPAPSTSTRCNTNSPATERASTEAGDHASLSW